MNDSLDGNNNVNNDVEEGVRRLLSKMISNDSIGMTVRTGNSNIKETEQPDKFIHYEYKPDEKMIPVEHDDDNAIPLGESSVVASVWTDGEDEYMIYRDRTAFKNRYR